MKEQQQQQQKQRGKFARMDNQFLEISHRSSFPLFYILFSSTSVLALIPSQSLSRSIVCKFIQSEWNCEDEEETKEFFIRQNIDGSVICGFCLKSDVRIFHFVSLFSIWIWCWLNFIGLYILFYVYIFFVLLHACRFHRKISYQIILFRLNFLFWSNANISDCNLMLWNRYKVYFNVLSVLNVGWTLRKSMNPSFCLIVRLSSLASLASLGELRKNSLSLIIYCYFYLAFVCRFASAQKKLKLCIQSTIIYK